MSILSESFNVVCSILEELTPIEQEMLTPMDKLEDMLSKNESLKLLINKLELTV